MSWTAPNLARTPFENLRPVRRLAGLLALVAAALTAWNVATWRAAGAGAQEKTAELERLVAETDRARERVTTLERDLAGADLEAENRRAAFLNARIAERVFSWNLLLDRLVETMPEGVRLRQLSPSPRQDRAKPGGGGGIDTVDLAIGGEAENDEALLEFVDRLFADPRFGRPDLNRQATRADGIVVFDLRVTYRPGPGGPAAAAPIGPETAPTPAPATPAPAGVEPGEETPVAAGDQGPRP